MPSKPRARSPKSYSTVAEYDDTSDEEDSVLPSWTSHSGVPHTDRATEQMRQTPPDGLASSEPPQAQPSPSLSREALKAMSIKELKSMMMAMGLNANGLLEKQDFVEAIIQSQAQRDHGITRM